jgi:hypothetical protein
MRAQLSPHLEPPSVSNENAPVRAAHRYIRNRLDQFDYRAAIEAGLPIGSGEVESAHRYVIQERLKISGAWWRDENAPLHVGSTDRARQWRLGAASADPKKH